MKVAVILSGRITAWQKCIETLKTRFTDLYDTDLYLSLDLDGETEDIREMKTKFRIISCYYERYTKYLKDIPYKSEETNERKSLSMFYHNFRAMNAILDNMKTTNTTYDVVVKFRADVTSSQPFIIQHNITPNTIYIPYGWCYRGMNDQIAYGDLRTMTFYCNLYNHIPKYVYVEKTIFNPEFLLMFHLNMNNISIIRIPYVYELHPDRFNQDQDDYDPLLNRLPLLDINKALKEDIDLDHDH
jgi:hypothetical protein